MNLPIILVLIYMNVFCSESVQLVEWIVFVNYF